jgi:hypothetical protein
MLFFIISLYINKIYNILLSFIINYVKIIKKIQFLP